MIILTEYASKLKPRLILKGELKYFIKNPVNPLILDILIQTNKISYNSE
jgi:hypothetical protein